VVRLAEPRRFQIGSIECWTVPDGLSAYTPAFWLANVDDATRANALEADIDERGYAISPYTCLLVRSGGRTALLGGRAGPARRTARGRPGSPAAHNLPPIEAAGLLELADAELDVIPGVRLIPTPGHTPGHLSVVMTSGREAAIYLGDVVTHESMFEHPEWLNAAEAIPARSVETRRRILAEAARDGMVVAAFHLATPGTCVSADAAFRFQPLADPGGEALPTTIPR
jgi:glyoxylase-like metal-dependent hydrolase (beta-lactamase superfamily II)